MGAPCFLMLSKDQENLFISEYLFLVTCQTLKICQNKKEKVLMTFQAKHLKLCSKKEEEDIVHSGVG